MDIRPIDMLHIVNKAIEVAKIQSEYQNYYINMRQSAVQEDKVEIERSKQRVNHSNNSLAEDKVSPDGKHKQSYRSFQEPGKDDDEGDKKISPPDSGIDIMI